MAVCPEEAVLVPGLSYEKDFFNLPEGKNEAADEDFFWLIKTRRAVRAFKDQDIPAEVLSRIVEAISFAPPGFPPLKTKLLVINDREVLKAALPLMISLYEKLEKMMRNPFVRHFIKKEVGAARFRTMNEHLLPVLANRLPALKKGGEDTLMRGAPALILFIADRNGEDISQDISIAATYGMLAVHALGLGGSIMDIIPPAIEKSPELRKMLGIHADDKVVTSLIIGYPRVKYSKGIKRELKEVRWIS